MLGGQEALPCVLALDRKDGEYKEESDVQQTKKVTVKV